VGKSKLILRRFQYLDGALVRQYLAQVPGGVEIQTRGTRETKGQTSVGAGAGYGPISAKAGKDKSSTETTEFEVERSAPADFNRLHSLATQQGLIQPLNALDDSIWSQLEVGELVEAKVAFALPKIHELLAAAEQFKELVGVIQAMGQELQPDQVKTIGMIDLIGPLLQNDKPTLIGSVVGSPKFRFVVPLTASNLMDELPNVRGEATVLGAIERKSARGGHITIVDLMKSLQGFLPNAAPPRRGRGRISQGPPPSLEDTFVDDQELRIAHPAALLTPVAIYR
jgi:hypothetical protein